MIREGGEGERGWGREKDLLSMHAPGKEERGSSLSGSFLNLARGGGLNDCPFSLTFKC